MKRKITHIIFIKILLDLIGLNKNCNDDEFIKILIESKLFFGSNVEDVSIGFILIDILILF